MSRLDVVFIFCVTGGMLLQIVYASAILVQSYNGINFPREQLLGLFVLMCIVFILALMAAIRTVCTQMRMTTGVSMDTYHPDSEDAT